MKLFNIGKLKNSSVSRHKVGDDFMDETTVEAIKKAKELFRTYQNMKPDVNGRYEKPADDNPLLPRRHEIDRIIGGMDGAAKEPVRLYLGGYSYRKIARMTQTNIFAVRKIVKNAMKELQNNFSVKN